MKKVLNIVTFAIAADEGTYLVILRCKLYLFTVSLRIFI